MDQRFQPTAKNDDYQDIIEALKSHYCLYRQKYVVISPEYTKTTKHYFKDGVLASHLEGRYALGVFAGEKATKFISIDVDSGGKTVVRKIVDALAEMGIPRDRIYISISGKKGYHVDMFFDPYIYNTDARNLYDLLIWRTGLDPHKVEFRPTHTMAIKLPLGIHAKTGNRCWYVDTETLEPIEQMEYVFCIQHMPAQVCADVLKTWNRKRWNEKYIEMVCDTPESRSSIKPEYDFSRKDEYFQEHRLTAKNTRHDMMLQMARDIRFNGATAGQIERFLMGWYYKQDPEYITSTEDEVRMDAREIASWAEENVPIIKMSLPPMDMKPIVFTKNEINYILLAPTSAARKVALLLWTYCKMYGAARISYDTIADTVGCVPASAKSAVAALMKAGIIHKESGGLHIVKGRMIKKSNTYFIPKQLKYGCPDDGDLITEEYVYMEPYSKKDFNQYYYRVLGGICTDEYLAKFLTKPELEEVRNIRNEK